MESQIILQEGIDKLLPKIGRGLLYILPETVGQLVLYIIGFIIVYQVIKHFKNGKHKDKQT